MSAEEKFLFLFRLYILTKRVLILVHRVRPREGLFETYILTVINMERNFDLICVHIREEIHQFRVFIQDIVDSQLADIDRVLAIDRKDTGLECIGDLRFFADHLRAGPGTSLFSSIAS